MASSPSSPDVNDQDAPYHFRKGDDDEVSLPESDEVSLPESDAAHALVHGAAKVTDNGRVEVNLDTKLIQLLSRFIPSQRECFPSTESLPLLSSDSGALPLNIVIQVVGSRGDVQPFIALGKELQKSGHRVRLATHNKFESFVRESDLEFYPIGGDPADLMAYMVKNPGLVPNMNSLRQGDIQKKRKMVEEMLEGCWNACIKPDPISNVPFVAGAIIANPPSFAHIHCAQALAVPLHLMFTMPWSGTEVFPHPLANILNAGANASLINYLSYGIIEWMTWQGLGGVINRWRRKLDLEPIPAREGASLVESMKIPFTYCWSPSLVSKPHDWRSHIDVCGFFFRDPPEYQPPPDLSEFLLRGAPPVYIGFGSIVIDEPEKMTATLLEAIEAAGVRAVISKGWSNLGNTEAPENVFFLDDCPHEWLFQRVSAVVHHGGAGTTACGLLNGRPTTVVPFFGDQPFWGNVIAAAGAGAKPIAPKDLSSPVLTEAIQFCLKPTVKEAAQTISAKMQNESGVKTAVESFHRHLPSNRLACDLLGGYPAVWSYKASPTRTVKLSALAAEILVRDGQLDKNELKLHQANPILIRPKRWNVVTGFTSAVLGSAADIAGSAGDMILDPYKEYKSVSARPSSASSSSQYSPSQQRGGTSLSPTKAALQASAKGLGRLHMTALKSTVEIPVAVADGFRSMARQCGDRVREHEPVVDWRSGLRVAGEGLVMDVFDSAVGVVVNPYKGARDDGAIGAAKGLAAWTVGMPFKICGSLTGLVAYPAQGFYKSIRSAANARTEKAIVAARRVEGAYLVEKEGWRINVKAMVQSWQNLVEDGGKIEGGKGERGFWRRVS